MPSINERLCCSVVSVRNFTQKTIAFSDISRADSFQYCTTPHFLYICVCVCGREKESVVEGKGEGLKYQGQ